MLGFVGPSQGLFYIRYGFVFNYRTSDISSCAFLKIYLDLKNYGLQIKLVEILKGLVCPDHKYTRSNSYIVNWYQAKSLNENRGMLYCPLADDTSFL